MEQLGLSCRCASRLCQQSTSPPAYLPHFQGKQTRAAFLEITPGPFSNVVPSLKCRLPCLMMPGYISQHLSRGKPLPRQRNTCVNSSNDQIRSWLRSKSRLSDAQGGFRNFKKPSWNTSWKPLRLGQNTRAPASWNLHHARLEVKREIWALSSKELSSCHRFKSKQNMSYKDSWCQRLLERAVVFKDNLKMHRFYSCSLLNKSVFKCSSCRRVWIVLVVKHFGKICGLKK